MDTAEEKTDEAPEARPNPGGGRGIEGALTAKPRERLESPSREGVAARSALYEYAEMIVTALVLALLIRNFVVQAFKIPTGSMQPTLEIGDHLLVLKFLYGTKIPFTEKRVLPVRRPERGDIIVFKYPDRPSDDYIKRIIGLPGDRIEVRQRKILVNGQPLDERWGYCLNGDRYVHIYEPDNGCPVVSSRDNFGPLEVPPNRYFVMGDNRDNSRDSRFWGTPTVPMEYIKGKAWVIYWSQMDWSSWPRLDRMFKLVR